MRLFESLPLTRALGRDANNFDLIRLIAACVVIYGHAFSISPEPGKQDPFIAWTGYPAAAMAVKMFFFLSGLLVTNSLIEKRSALQFLIARFFRIWPALLLVLIGSAFVIGPLCTRLDLGTYFSDPNTYLYIKRQAFMQTWATQAAGYYNLPGVFEGNPFKSTVNASLWSLVVEIYAYLVLVALFLVGFTSRKAATLVIALVLLDAVLPTRLIFWFLPKGNEDFSYLPFCFAVGAGMAIFKDKVQINIGIPIGFAMLFYLFHGGEHERYFFYLTAFTAALYLATLPAALRLRPPADLSYGVFLWGFPIQQMFAMLFPGRGVLMNQIFSTLIALGMAYVSWHLVEKRAIDFGRHLSKKIDLARNGAKSTFANNNSAT